MWVLRVPRDLLFSVLSLSEAFHEKTYDKGIRIAGTRKTTHMHVCGGRRFINDARSASAMVKNVRRWIPS